MKIKNIFLLISIVIAPAIHAMEQPNRQQTEQPSRRPYPANLPRLLYFGDREDESCLNMLPDELIAEIISHIKKIQTDQDLLNVKNDRNLLNAVRGNYKGRIIRRLLKESYIDVNITDRFGNTLLFLAVENFNRKIVRMLLDKGANLNIQNNNGTTALMRAVEHEDSKTVTLLLDNGADPDIQNKQGHTTLMWAVEHHIKPEIVQLLLDANANLNIQDKDGYTALICATRGHDLPKMVKMLLGKGANLDMQDNDGNTALHWAIRDNKSEIVQILLDRGANPDIQNNSGDTPLIQAVSAIHDNSEIVKLLLNKGANLNIKGSKRYGMRYTALELATRQEGCSFKDDRANRAIFYLLTEAEERANDASANIGTSGSTMEQPSKKSHRCIVQ